MTDTKIKALIAQVEEMIAEQERVKEQLWNDETGEYVLGIITGMRQVLAVIRLYEE